MKRLARILIGSRDDLALQGRWWHRLVLLIFVVGSLIQVLLTFALLYSSPPQLRTSDVTIIDNLGAFTHRQPKSVANASPGFLALDGDLGLLKDGTVESFSRYDVEQSFCSPDFRQHAEQAASFFNDREFNPVKVRADMLVVMADQATCVMPGVAKSVEVKDIVKYRVTASHKSKHLLKTAGTTGWVWLLSWLILGNLYYRGVIYVTFGRRDSAPRM